MEFRTNDGKRATIFPSISNGGGMEWQVIDSSRILRLPQSTLIDILSRLPIKTVINIRCVCKKLLHLISDPKFAKLHLSRSPISILIKTMPRKNDSRRLQLAQVVDNGGAKFQVEKMNLTLKNNIPSCEIGNTNSCNGLLCLYGASKDDPVYVCNPILGEYITIQSPYKGRHRSSFSGLGYSVATDQYKLIQTFYPPVESSCLEDSLETAIYTLGTGMWRSVGNAPRDLVNLPFNSFLNGALHWAPCAPNNSEFIWSFDFDSEQFRPVPPPLHYSDNDKKLTDFMRLGVLGECLYISVFDDSSKFEIWVMKEYGIRESWSKQFVIENLYPRARGWDFYEPMLILKNGEILMHYNGEVVVCYNQKRKSLRETKFFRTRSEFSAVAYTPCFVSLFDVAKGEHQTITRMRSVVEYNKSPGEELYTNFAEYGVQHTVTPPTNLTLAMSDGRSSEFRFASFGVNLGSFS